MTLYMYQASYTAKSMAAQLTEPHDPMEAIGPTLKDLGATIVVAGFPFGEYDVLIAYEAADDVTAARTPPRPDRQNTRPDPKSPAKLAVTSV
jgi:uncharacterized protein with GYD domain